MHLEHSVPRLCSLAVSQKGQWSSLQAWKMPARFLWVEGFWAVDLFGLSRVWLFCDPTDCSLPGSFLHGIFQARILEWAATPSSRGSSRPRDRTCMSCIGRWILYHWATWELRTWLTQKSFVSSCRKRLGLHVTFWTWSYILPKRVCTLIVTQIIASFISEWIA